MSASVGAMVIQSPAPLYPNDPVAAGRNVMRAAKPRGSLRDTVRPDVCRSKLLEALPPLRIVLTSIEGNAAALKKRIERILPHSAGVVLCPSAEMLREITRFNDYDAVLLDWRNTDQGTEPVAAAVRACPMIPLIVVSSEPESARAHSAAGRAGWRDTNGKQLLRAIYHAIERKRLDIRLKMTLGELGQANARLRSLAFKDVLTGAMNRRAFFAIGSQMLARARRHDRELALLYCDLDGFKQINDRLGHAAGDAVLKAFRQRCAAVLRRGDHLARLGGDEFVILLESLGAPDVAVTTAQRIRDAFTAPLSGVAEDDVRLEVSIGIARFPQCATIEALIGAADQAMYRAKAGAGIACFEEDGEAAVRG